MMLKTVLLLSALILLPLGCTSSAARTDVSLPPVPTTPGAIITPDGLICLPPDEAGALLLWMEYAESNGSL